MSTLPLPAAQIEDPPLQLDEPESSTPETQEEDLGDWNERLDPDLQDCLKKLADHFCGEFRYPRRLEVMTSWKARSFWREMQHLTWNWDSQSWDAGGALGTRMGTQAEKTDSAVLYSTNMYQGFGDSYIAIITQNVPALRFEPEDPDEAADVETAKAAEPMRKIIQHENDPIKLMTKAAYYSWTDGRMHGWTTWAEDKRTGKPRETQKVFGSMEVKVPVIADEQSEYLYLQFSTEYHIATVRQKVKGRKFEDSFYYKKIKAGAGGNGQDTYERTARISAKQGISMRTAGGDAYAHLVTTQRTWCRPESFLSDCVEESHQDELLKLFPTGCYMEFDNGTYTGSRDANMDDEWTVENIMEGDGQFRNGKGQCLISVQERANDIINTTQDVYEKTQPASHWDDKLFDLDGMRRQRSMPGARYGIDVSKLQVGDTIAGHVFFEPAATVSPDMLAYLKELMVEVPQFLTGISAILFGQDSGGDKSGKALSIQQNMAMGRIGLPWRTMKRFYARMMEQGIRCATRNRKSDVKQGIPDQSGNIETIQVRIEQLTGKIRCFPQDQEGMPMSMIEKRAAYQHLMQEGNADPALRATLMLPKNQELAKKLIGLEDLEIAGADSWNKQMKEINLLLVEPPKIVPSTPTQVPNPLVPGVMETIIIPAHPEASIGIDADWDDHQEEYLTVKIWVNSTAGQKALQANSQGVANVKLHGKLHQQQIMKAMQAAQPPPPPPQPAPIHLHAGGPPKPEAKPATPPAPGIAA